jgi:hypothetical protein
LTQKFQGLFEEERAEHDARHGWDRFAEDHSVRHGLGEPAFSNVMGVWGADLLVALQNHCKSSL